MHKSRSHTPLDVLKNKASLALKESIKNIDSYTHLRGESLYVDDVNVREGTFYSVVFDSPKAHGKIINIDYSKAEQLEGVARIFTYKDIPGENQIGGIIPDEPLFAEDEVHFWGQPIALIVAKNCQPMLSNARKLKRTTDLSTHVSHARNLLMTQI